MISTKSKYLNKSLCGKSLLATFLTLLTCHSFSSAQIHFCNEVVPIEVSVVKEKLKEMLEKNYSNGVNSIATRQRAAYYFPYIQEVLKKYGIPDDYKFMPLVESRLKNAKSNAGAGGFWQIMPATAKDLGLVVDRAADERNNIIKSTNAAARYILSLYQQTNSWTLTAASYNFGIGNIGSVIKKQGTRNYYKMRLNQETAEYLYNLVACKLIYSYSIFDGKALEQFLSNEGKKVIHESPGQSQPLLQEVMFHTENVLASNPSKQTSIGSFVSKPVKARVMGGSYFFQSGKIYLRLMEPVTLEKVTLPRNTKIEAILYTDEKDNSRIFADIPGIDIDMQLGLYYGTIIDIDRKPGISIANNTTKGGHVFLQESYEVSLIWKKDLE